MNTSPRPAIGHVISAAVLGAVLVDLAVETVLSVSPIRWSVLGIAALAVAAGVLLWRHLSPTMRAVLPLAALLGLIVWATLRLGTAADPALQLATLSLARIATALAIIGSAAAVALLFGFGIVRRYSYIGAIVGVIALYAAVSLARGFMSGASLAQILAGQFEWQQLPVWLRGSYLAAQVVLPIGLIAGVALTVTRTIRRAGAAWAVGGVLVVLAAFLTLSVEMTRAGLPNVARAVLDPVIARVSLAQPSATAAATEEAASGVSSPAAGGDQQRDASLPAPAVTPVTVARTGQPVANNAIELRVTNVRTASSIGNRTAAQGREFVMIDTAWKNLLQPQRVTRKAAEDRTQGAGGLGFGGGTGAKERAEEEANTTIESVRFQVSPLTNYLWLLVDGRLAEAIDTEATDAVNGHLPTDILEIEKFQEVRTGSVAFQAPANAQALALLFLDTNHGHVVLPIKGAPPRLASSLGGPSHANEFVDLTLTGASWAEGAAKDPGMRTLVLTIKGISLQNAMVDMPFGEFASLQTDQGCIAQPDEQSPAVLRPLAPVGRFIPLAPNEGQLAFTLPAATRGATFVFRASQGKPIEFPVLGDASPQRPATRATVTDGSTLKLHLVGTLSGAPAGVEPPESGREYIVVDYLVENLHATQGLELQPAEQLALVDGAGEHHAPDAASDRLPCRLTGAGVVPAGGWRRFSLLYTVPAGQPLIVEYRGFESSGKLKVR